MAIGIRGKKKRGTRRCPFQLGKPCSRRVLFEVLRTALSALALGALRNILQFSAFKQGFHDDLSTASAKELVRCNGRTRVLTGSTHDKSPENKVKLRI
jgi:hypothetical protein